MVLASSVALDALRHERNDRVFARLERGDSLQVHAE
jgi:hypothetical protein